MIRRLSTLAVAAVTLTIAMAPAHGAEKWDAAPWLADVEVMHQAFATKYANRMWLEEQRAIPVDALFAFLSRQIESAGSDAEARAILDRVMWQIGDGHVTIDWDRADHAAASPAPASAPKDAESLCRSIGFANRHGSRGVAAALRGYKPLGQKGLLAAGTVERNGTRLGVIRIPVFEAEAFPETCEAAVAAQRVLLDRPCDDDCQGEIVGAAYAALTADLEDRLRALRAAGATTLLVDITDNGGGSEWAEAVARTLTPKRLRSERHGFVRGPHWAKIWGDLAARLRGWAKTAGPDDRAKLTAWATQADAAQHIAQTSCDPRTGCEWLGKAGYATGLVGDAGPDDIDGPWEAYIFSPGQHPYHEGVWDGPVIVLVDQETWSAAEEFAALLQDNQAATIVGARTGGAGCGHTWGGTPTRLERIGATLELPDCVRFRADGSNEVSGVIPDTLIGWRANDSTALKLRLLEQALDSQR